MVPLAWIEHATSPLPRECSTTELQGLNPFCNTIWSGERESNPRHQLGRLRFYHLTTAAKLCFNNHKQFNLLVEGEGFEPSKAEPTDLQSVPFDRSGTPPTEPSIILIPRNHVKKKVNKNVPARGDLPQAFAAPCQAGLLSLHAYILIAFNAK